MGIRFQCPNGHDLHVKSQLAGKRGICPKCGVKLLIPKDLGNLKADGQVGTAPKTLPSNVAQAPNALTSTSKTAPGGGQQREIAVPPPPTATVGENLSPIEQAPQALWFLRTPSGEQFGPASHDVFLSWIDEGRVSSGCFVWREGWDDWRTAEELPEFRRFVAPPVANEPMASPTTPFDADLRISTAPRVSSRTRRRKKTLVLVFILLCLCLLLLVPLVYLVKVGP